MSNLKELIESDAAKQKREIMARDATLLTSKLLAAGIINEPVIDRVKVRDGKARLEIDGVAFYLHRFDNWEYDDEGNRTENKTFAQLTASRICSGEGCNRDASGLYVAAVNRAADLKSLFYDLYDGHEIKDPRCSQGKYCGTSVGDNDLEDLPF